MTFTVIDTATGREPDLEKILMEDWARTLVYSDMDGFVIEDEGALLLADECGNYVIPPPGRFKVEFPEIKRLKRLVKAQNQLLMAFQEHLNPLPTAIEDVIPGYREMTKAIRKLRKV
jgi:hypothetical protein